MYYYNAIFCTLNFTYVLLFSFVLVGRVVVQMQAHKATDAKKICHLMNYIL